jgi:hypothetical protein
MSTQPKKIYKQKVIFFQSRSYGVQSFSFGGLAKAEALDSNLKHAILKITIISIAEHSQF